MTSSKSTRDLVKQGLEVEINKRISVSVFDRFGKNNFMFLNQFDKTKKSLKNFETQKLRYNLEDSLITVDQEIQEKKKELLLLSRFNKKKISEAENLWDQAAELKEEIQSELDFLQSQTQSNTTNVQDTEFCGDEQDKEATIIQWKLDALPKVPTN